MERSERNPGFSFCYVPKVLRVSPGSDRIYPGYMPPEVIAWTITQALLQYKYSIN